MDVDGGWRVGAEVDSAAIHLQTAGQLAVQIMQRTAQETKRLALLHLRPAQAGQIVARNGAVFADQIG